MKTEQSTKNSKLAAVRLLYSFLTRISYAHIWLTQFFSRKMKLFVKGRESVFATIEKTIQPKDKTIWFHCASLGEFEQGYPIMQALKETLPNYKLVVTFFSPSGYEIKKDTPIADVVAYLPADTIANAKKFITLANPAVAIFVKYEFWPNYLFELQQHKIPALLVSGLFRKNQSFFKAHGGFMRKALKTIDHFFVQNEASEALLKSINISNVTVSGDTRFDRVSHQIEQDNSLDFMEDFKKSELCIVCGSTWPEDEAILVPFINNSETSIKFVVAPHKIESQKVGSLKNQLEVDTILYSEKKQHDLSSAKVLIVDHIGLLTKIYNYADIAYVGGAMGTTGLHNILEPATFGVPVVIGKNFDKFPEAKRLQSLAGLFSVNSSEEISTVFNKLISDKSLRDKTGMIAGHYINSNTGATKTIVDYILKLHGDGMI